jgi:hypothetical protein
MSQKLNSCSFMLALRKRLSYLDNVDAHLRGGKCVLILEPSICRRVRWSDLLSGARRPQRLSKRYVIDDMALLAEALAARHKPSPDAVVFTDD